MYILHLDVYNPVIIYNISRRLYIYLYVFMYTIVHKYKKCASTHLSDKRFRISYIATLYHNSKL